MKIVRPSATLIGASLDPLQRLEAAGRTCYKSEDRITEDSALKFVEKIIKMGHESVLEHVSATLRLVCDRGVSHELVRHRIASYSQESTRYCNYKGKDIEFIAPPFVGPVVKGKSVEGECWILPGDGGFAYSPNSAELAWLHACEKAEESYNEIIEQGFKPQDARSVLPNSLKTEVVMTANLREWRHFLKLRLSPKAHPQMRELADMIRKELLQWVGSESILQ